MIPPLSGALTKIGIILEEMELINRYLVHDHVLTWINTGIDQMPGLVVRDLVQDTTAGIGGITALLNDGEVIKGACESFNSLYIIIASLSERK